MAVLNLLPMQPATLPATWPTWTTGLDVGF
jgi:hypothetical protein